MTPCPPTLHLLPEFQQSSPTTFWQTDRADTPGQNHHLTSLAPFTVKLARKLILSNKDHQKRGKTSRFDCQLCVYSDINTIRILTDVNTTGSNIKTPLPGASDVVQTSQGCSGMSQQLVAETVTDMRYHRHNCNKKS